MTFDEPDLLRLGAVVALVVAIGLIRFGVRRRRLARHLGGRSVAARLADVDLYRLPLERIALLCAAAVACAAAAAGPRWDAPPPPPMPPPPVHSVVLAIDVSASMQATDVEPNRLARAARVAEELIASLPTDRIGILLFAGRTYELAPPTTDHDALGYLLAGVTPTVASAHDPGSLLSAAVTDALRELDRWAPDDEQRSIVLLTDGEGGEGAASVDAAVTAAREAGVRTHAVGLGTATGAGMVMPRAPFQLGGRIVDSDGNPALSRLRSATLTRVAAAGDGVYAAADDPGSVEALAEVLSAPSVATATETPPAPEALARVDPTILLIGAALLLLLLESLLDVRLPAWTRAPVRRPA